MSEAEILETLKMFQEGYRARDAERIEWFMELFDDSPGLEVIGTNAVRKLEGEWTFGQDAARKLVLDDWAGWGDLELDLENATVRAEGDAGWVSLYGVLKYELDPERNCEDFLGYARKLAEEEGEARMRLLDMLRLGSNTIYNAQRGPLFTNPIRITAVLVKRDDTWKFAQMHFSFCTSDFPDIRL